MPVIRKYGCFVKMLENSKAAKKPAFFMAQGCNCFKAQGSGLAGQLRKFPEIFQADKDYRSGDEGKRQLGLFSVARIPFDEPSLTKPKKSFSAAVCFNLYTQFDTGTDYRRANYAAIGIAFRKLNDSLSDTNRDRQTLYTHEIGCGLAGGDLDIVIAIINDATPDIDVVMLDWSPNVDPRDEMTDVKVNDDVAS